MSRSFVVFGDETLTIECLNLLVEAGHTVPLLVSRSPDVMAWAGERGVNYRTAISGRIPDCDYVLSAANLRMLPTGVLDAPRIAALNFHDGPLPQYAGLNAPVWALLEGASRYGITWHLMTAEPDAGDILEQELFDLDDEETALSLNTRCFEAGISAFRRLLPRLAMGEPSGKPQDLSARSYYELGHPLPGGGVIDPGGSGDAACRLVRGLDFGHYANPVGSAWLAGPGGALRVASAKTAGDAPHGPAGQLRRAGDVLHLQCADGVVTLSGFSSAGGEVLTAKAALAALGPGNGPATLSTDWLRDAESLSGAAAKAEARHLRALAVAAPELPYLRNTGEPASRGQVQTSLSGAPATAVVAALGQFIARLTGRSSRVWVATEERAGAVAAHRALFDPFVPLAFQHEMPREQALRRAAEAFDGAPLSRDAGARHPGRANMSGDRVAVDFAGSNGDEFNLMLVCEGDQAHWDFDTARFRREDIVAFAEGFRHYVSTFTAGEPLSVLSPAQTELLRRWNATAVDFDRQATVVSAFEQLVDANPLAVALIGGGQSMTYRELDARANALAHRLMALGAGPDQLVAVHLGRSLELVVSLLAILKAGAAYVPVDPAYPAARKALMVEDSGARLVITDLPVSVPAGVTLVAADEMDGDTTRLAPRAAANNLAYVIYTSGSTGRPKGVMLEHRNVVNFFHGMDDRVGKDPGAWLAVTSISFDISVLELLWTLTRGFTVVVHGVTEPATTALPSLSVFFFGSSASPDAYTLLMDAARFADANGFEAVWTPERHFHAFGGAFPNASVTSAALAAATTRVQIRAGSCVLPLHTPIRVAEEWALVDQLSRGRAGVAFASGWMPNDFVINPAGFRQSKAELVAGIRQVQSLWRGETLEFTGHDGNQVAITTLPGPVQAEVPVWLTSAGDPETFRVAGEQGMNLLTHLLGQSMDELNRKIGIYRDAWKAAGHPGSGKVTLMLHAYVSESDDDARETVREPMIAYLGSSVSLVKNFVTSFPTFKNASASDGELLEALSPGEVRELLEVAFERYYETSGLFGDAERAGEMLREARRIGVDEVACLVDFGVAPDLVIRSLERIAALREGSAPEAAKSIPELIERHGVSHFQCTPSMAGMLAADAHFREAAHRLSVMMVGGEAFPADLANDLAGVVGGRLINMYGPTETTIWSTTSEVTQGAGGVSIGTPIANTTVYILGAERQLLPPGACGELWIGGEGVARGYLGRDDLTSERFVADPFSGGEGARMYRTGDLARFESDGTLIFLGRVDQQVKVRGYRIEPGEIESIVRAQPGVTEAVVIAREDIPGDQRLVCYYAALGSIEPLQLRDAVSAELPTYMVPTNFVRLDTLPLTPNKKVDRNALPPPGQVQQDICPVATARAGAAHAPVSTPGGVIQPEAIGLVSESWAEVLRTPDLPRNRTFFDCGGNSLLLLQLHKRLLPHHPSLKLTDLFRHPTIDSLASYLGDNSASTPEGDDVSRRALARRSAPGRRPIHA